MNYKDAALVNSSLNNLGDALLQDRMIRMRQSEAQADRDLRTRQLDATLSEADKRTQIERDRLGAQQQHYKTIEEQNAARAAATANQQDIADKGRMLQTLIQLNAGGQLQDLDSVNSWLAEDPHFAQTGIQLKEPPTKPDPQVGQNSYAQALKQAQAYHDAAAKATDPEEVKRLNGYAQLLETFVQHAANPPEKTGRKPIQLKSKGPQEDSNITREFESEEELQNFLKANKPAGEGETVLMTNPQGKTVKVPVTEKANALANGYKLLDTK